MPACFAFPVCLLLLLGASGLDRQAAADDLAAHFDTPHRAPQRTTVAFRTSLQRQVPTAAATQRSAEPVDLRTSSRQPRRVAVSARPEIGPLPDAASSSDKLEPLDGPLRVAPKAAASGPGPMVFESVGPAIRVAANGPKQVLVGESAVYTVVVRNQGDATARGVFVRVGLPASVELTRADATGGEVQQDNPSSGRQVVWMFDRLEARERQQLELEVVARSGEPIDLALEWTILPLAGTVQIQALRPEIEVALSGPRTVLFGDEPVYTVDVTNVGTGEVRDVEVVLATKGGAPQRVPIDLIAAGETSSFQVQISKLEPGAAELAATATAHPDISSAAFQAIDVQQAELRVAAFGPTSRIVGSQATYQMQIRNVGTARAEDVTASVLLPAGVEYLGGGVDDAYQVGDEVVWDMGGLDQGEERWFEIRCELTEPTQCEVKFGVVDGRENRAESAVLTAIEALPNVQMTVETSGNKVPVGEDFTYAIRCENRGNEVAEQVQVDAQFAPGVEPLATEGGQARIEGSSVKFAPLPRLEPGEVVVLRITARATRTGNHRFRAELTTADPNPGLAFENQTSFFDADEPTRPVARRSAVFLR